MLKVTDLERVQRIDNMICRFLLPLFERECGCDAISWIFSVIVWRGDKPIGCAVRRFIVKLKHVQVDGRERKPSCINTRYDECRLFDIYSDINLSSVQYWWNGRLMSHDSTSSVQTSWLHVLYVNFPFIYSKSGDSRSWNDHLVYQILIFSRNCRLNSR